MGDNEALRTTGVAIVKNVTPDVCMTPPGNVPVPYEIIGRFSDGVRYANTVCMDGLGVMTMDSRLTTVYGDEPGEAGGILSGVNMGWCRPITHAGNVRARGHEVIFHSAIYWMNCNGPEGAGNTTGRVIFVESIDCVYIGPLGGIEQDTNPPVEPEEEEKSWWDAVSPWVHGALDVVGMIPGVGEIADGANAIIYAAEGDYENAILSAASMIPLAGNAATAAKWAKRADKAIDAVKTIDRAKDIGKTIERTKDVANSIKKIRKPSATTGTKVTKQLKNPGRSGKQTRLRELANDLKVPRRERGWIRHQLNQIKRGKRRSIRVPEGRQLAHRRGFDAKDGYSYKYSDLQDIGLHKTQTKYQRMRKK